MTEAEQQAFSIYELIGTTSANRPIAFRSIEQAQRETAAWQATNPGLQAMRNAPPEVLLAFCAITKSGAPRPIAATTTR
jgi:hypothetical protein